MKIPSTKLFQLIKKLSPSEKRYFKRFSLLQQKGNFNKYTLLFDAINNQEKYNEAQLILQFKEYDFVNNFSEIKKYLFQQIQKALRNFHAQSSINIILYGYLSNISILYNKELYLECESLIKKAKKEASKHEKWAILLLLNEWKRNIIKISHQTKGIEDYLNKEIAEDQKYIRAIINEQDFFEKSLTKNLESRKFGSNTDSKKSLHSSSNLTPLTFLAKRYFWAEKGSIGYAQYDAEKIYTASKEEIILFEQNPHFIKDKPKQYIIALINILAASRAFKYNAFFDDYMHQAFSVLDQYPFNDEFKIKEKLIIYIFKCNVYTKRNNSEDLQEVRQEITQQIKQTQKQYSIDNTLACYAHYCLLYSAIVLGQYQQALQHYHDFSNLNLGDYRVDIQIEAKIMGLIAHFELGNWLLLDSLVRSASRLIKRKESQLTFNKNLVTIIQKSIPHKHEPKEEKLIKELKKMRLNIEGQFLNKKQAYYFIFLAWIDHKITNSSMLECIYQNLSKES